MDKDEKHLNKLIVAGVIEPSISEWASAPVLVRKKDGTIRWCVDYRALNKVTKKDVFPLSLVEEWLDTLTCNVWFSKLDANLAYLQEKVNDEKKSSIYNKIRIFSVQQNEVRTLQHTEYFFKSDESGVT